MNLFFEFTVCSILIIISSHFISNEGLKLAAKLNWHEGFIGVLFLAIATSLPEVSTSISSIFAANSIDLGFGDAMGSLVINLMLIGVLDYFQGHGRFFLKADKKNVLTALFTAVLLIVIIAFAFLRIKLLSGFSLCGIGIESFIIMALYFLGIKFLFKSRHSENKTVLNIQKDFTILKFILLFFVIIILGLWLAGIGKRISETSSINQTFIGALFLAFSTSLPEFAVSLSALRMGSINMALGNILGSNFFDVCIIPLMDIIYSKNAILQALAPVNILTAILALLLTLVVILGLLIRSRDTKMRMGWDTILILILGATGYYFIYRIG